MTAEEPQIKLRLAHAYGVYPSALRDAVIALSDETFTFCVGRHIAICDQSRQRTAFLSRDPRHRVITAMTKSSNGKLLAVGERMGSDDGSVPHAVQISILAVPKAETLSETKAEMKEETLKVLHPANKRLDIIGLAFTAEGKYLVSLSSLPESTVTYWRWESEKPVSSHDIQLNVNRLLVNPSSPSQFSVSGPTYLRLWDYNPNDHGLNENPSMFPLKQEREMKVVDHCWVLATFLCAASEDGHVYIFEEGEQREDVDVRAVIEKDESVGPKAAEREQAKTLQKLMGGDGPTAAVEPPGVRLSALAAWGRGFVVGGNQGYVGVFKVDAKAQVESIGTFRMAGEKAIIWQMSASAEDSSMTILSYEEQEVETMGGNTAGAKRSDSASRRSVTSRSSSAGNRPERQSNGNMWSLSVFPVGQADLAATGQLEVFTPVFPTGNHHGKITAMKPAFSRRVICTCSEDKQLKVWGYPSEEAEAGPNAFTSELSVQASPFETPTTMAVHPLGFQVALILEDMLRIYHLTTQAATRTHFDLPLKHPGGVSYSNSGSMLAVSSENDVVLIDPWRAVVVHMFSGRGGHLSQVNQVLFSEDDRMLLSSGMAPHGAIYGWDLTTENRERAFEHVSKLSTYTDLNFDNRLQLAVAVVKPEGHLRVISHLSTTQIEVQPESRGSVYTSLCLCSALGLLLAGTQQGSVRCFRWPLPEAGATYFAEVPLHAHGISAMALSYDARYLFSGCEGGTVMCCEVGATTLQPDGTSMKINAMQLDQKLVRARHGEVEKPVLNKAQRDDEKKMADMQRKIWDAVRAISATTASLDDLLQVPKNYFSDVLSEIRELEDRMQGMKHENDHMLEQKENEMQEKLQTIQMERRQEKKVADDKYDGLFLQLKQTNLRHGQEQEEANAQFDQRNRQLQDNFEGSISKEYQKQSKLLDELQALRDEFDRSKSKMAQEHNDQLSELRATQERAMREWRAEYEKVCNLLKSDGLKFEEALRQQENEYEGQIVEILERERKALQDESEKSTTALKDGVSMKQTIAMLQNQVKSKDAELAEASKEQDDMRKKLQASQEMADKVRAQLKERERSLKVKDEALYKLREQMKHLESFRFVLFHKVRALEEERDPLEEQVNSLKTSVREMYSEFVREFRQKQKLDQLLSDKSTLSNALQAENVQLQEHLVQLKKDGRRMLQDVEAVVHAENTADYVNMGKKLEAVCDRHQKLAAWKPPVDDPGNEPRTEADLKKGTALMEEMAQQRDLLFRKKEMASASAEQAKRECASDIRKLTSENAALIAEMNTLRTENRSYLRSCKEMEAKIMAMKNPGQTAISQTASAPDLGGGAAKNRVPPSGRPLPSSDTPYVRRKIVDAQEQYRRARQKQANQLPPVSQQSSSPMARMRRAEPTSEEARFAQSMEGMQAQRNHMENQGFNMSKLHETAADMAADDGGPAGQQ
mmetsp:Transcript_26950/g.48715  ORF Transcript_26950/g.48715 Transcript_26950/m.48715 type:complete len:1443 (+) Transcript_26950:61-4389(+)|eukprot:CAMPEP_0197664830 /NCGR_PEP_ID=MMETSP1338-20131121/58876_1 /TAXON_ID=43686 ORGANISM="Pelagodinium beii, Strain RCC1491" /NCGR_SAMPLE_ID=MMETSP1338 /ASSEMBLY_ACC=CAM_ASM_000754 /LENGTH=1442 /DNA_ID=CAMNT_0043243549 /DNA_START=58 /DNA_END=4386 /DNA_ORIENTATION=+